MLINGSNESESGGHWKIIILVLTLLVFFVNFISYLFDITDTVANLFLIPVIIATFFFRKKGMVYTLAVMGIYLVFVWAVAPEPSVIVDAGEHAIVMAGLGLIITLLSIALHSSEEKYRLLFETSPAPLIVTDSNGIITDVNDNFYSQFGYDKKCLVGFPVQKLNFIAEGSRKVIEAVMLSGKSPGLQKSKIKSPPEIYIEDEKGSVHTCRLFFSASDRSDTDAEMKMISLLDITDNVIAEKRIKLSLKEKEMLLREVHHRVKNNLQIIVSILRLQLSRTSDPKTRDILRDCQSRVYSMAMVHEKMYRSESLATIDIREYLEHLSKDILMEYSDMIGRVTIDVTSEKDLNFDLDTIVPCALITSELLTNSMKYAFPGNRQGHIKIDIYGKKAPYTLYYKDDGVGIPENFDPEYVDTLGIKIVMSLVKQLRGNMVMRNSSGTEIIVIFPVETDLNV
ncbi:PAS domain S-box-containing protein [Methanomicrobium sp. W14]|uniref:sensor histidine kinase n=1 Tax=Methanomicrobium sp. W14 TaxID=2817839 RepID=UPI001AE34DBC|nr:histidine kinase dimerization/phosphoacceptor domain -containing protein [Methanomicrobium sp. W14]MBP2133450.1 PAS domain S-box-containing protein [Methanomicrobium sp. W14]